MRANATKPISILLVDDSELVRIGLKSLLNTSLDNSELLVVGEAATAAAGVAECLRLEPDVVLLDIRLPDETGFFVCRQILAKLPDTRILILTSVIDDGMIYEAMSSGAHGYLLKEINTHALLQAVVDVARGKFILDPSVTTRVLNLVRNGPPQADGDKIAQLSTQERRVLALVAEGLTNREIGEQMELSAKTVKNYLSNIFEKLSINRRAQAAVLYSESRVAGTGQSAL